MMDGTHLVSKQGSKIDQQAAKSLRKNEASRSGDDLSHAAAPKKAGDILPPLKDQLKKKKAQPEKTDFVAKSRNHVSPTLDNEIVAFLIPLLDDKFPLIRSISCWTLCTRLLNNFFNKKSGVQVKVSKPSVLN